MKRLYALLLVVVMIVCSAVPVLAKGESETLSEEHRNEAIDTLYNFVIENGKEEKKWKENGSIGIPYYLYTYTDYIDDSIVEITCRNDVPQVVTINIFTDNRHIKCSFTISSEDTETIRINYYIQNNTGKTIYGTIINLNYSEYNNTDEYQITEHLTNPENTFYDSGVSRGIHRSIKAVQMSLKDNLKLSLQKFGFRDFDNSNLKSISISPSECTLYEDEEKHLVVNYFPATAIHENLYWSSSNKLVVGVYDGTLFAHYPGEAIVTAKTEDGKISATCKVVVKDENEELNPNPDPDPEPSEQDSKNQISDFVSRMYTVALGREAESKGLNDWSTQLKEGKSDGATLARGFISSSEFMNKGLSNEQFVDVLYHTFFNRDPDEGGKTGWLTALSDGASRESVLAGFVNSLEFANLCDGYGIPRGTMEDDGSSIYNKGVRDFVLRNYTETLGRAGETMGVEDWSYRINKGELTMKDVAVSFLHSEEFLNKGLNDEEYVKVLYRTFLGREADAAGLADWTGQLAGGKSRDDIVSGFSDSQEFANIMAQYQ